MLITKVEGPCESLRNFTIYHIPPNEAQNYPKLAIYIVSNSMHFFLR